MLEFMNTITDKSEWESKVGVALNVLEKGFNLFCPRFLRPT